MMRKAIQKNNNFIYFGNYVCVIIASFNDIVKKTRVSLLI